MTTVDLDTLDITPAEFDAAIARAEAAVWKQARAHYAPILKGFDPKQKRDRTGKWAPALHPDELVADPGADRRTVAAMAASHPVGSAARDYLESAAHNLRGDDSGVTGADRRRDTVKQLGELHRAAHDAGDHDTAGHVAGALAHFGAHLHGPAEGEQVPFSGRYHDGFPGAFPGDAVTVHRRPVVLPGADRDHVAVKGKVGPVGVKKAVEGVEYTDPAPYGYCPECRGPGITAERRINGNAHCANGHAYPRTKAKYASTQVQLTGAAAKKLKAMAASIPDADLGEDGREDDPHITARYGLHADGPEQVEHVVSGFGPVEVKLGRLNAFRGAEAGKDYDVIHAEVDSPDLHRLNETLGALPHTDTHATYHPHATVAYVKAGLADKYLAALGAVDESATTDRMTFSTAKRDKTVIRLTDGVQKAVEPDDDVTPEEVLAAAIDHLLADRAAGGDGAAGLAALHRIGATVRKAAKFRADLHPRGDDGKFVPKELIARAAKNPALAAKVRAKATDPDERQKLDDAIAGDTHHSILGSDREAAAYHAGEKRAHKMASRDEARRLRDKLSMQHRSGEPLDPSLLRQIIPHLSTLNHAELSNIRLMLSGAGAGFGGATLREDRVAALVKWASGAAIDADNAKLPPFSLLSRGRRDAAVNGAKRDAEDAGVKVPAAVVEEGPDGTPQFVPYTPKVRPTPSAPAGPAAPATEVAAPAPAKESATNVATGVDATNVGGNTTPVPPTGGGATGEGKTVQRVEITAGGRNFQQAVKYLKKIGATFDPNTKTWAVPAGKELDADQHRTWGTRAVIPAAALPDGYEAGDMDDVNDRTPY